MTAALPALAIRPYRCSDDAAIERLNARFRAAGSSYEQYTIDLAAMNPTSDHHERLFVVADGDEIRGGAYLRETPFAIGDLTTTLGFVKYPLSESLIDRTYSGVPAAILLQLLREQPQLAAVGMGGHQGPFAQLLTRLRWTGDTVASYVWPMRPHVVAAALPQLQRSPRLRRLASLVRCSGVGHVASAILPTLLRLRLHALRRSTTLIPVNEFSSDIDDLWLRARPAYPAIGARDSNAARWRFPQGVPGLERFEVRREGRLVGWFVLQVLDMRPMGSASPYGPLTLGIFHDCLALPADAATVTAWALDELFARRVDLALAIHSHPAWQRALRRIGFVLAPDTFAFYRALATSRVFASQGIDAAQLYLTRADDGFLVFSPESWGGGRAQ